MQVGTFRFRRLFPLPWLAALQVAGCAYITDDELAAQKALRDSGAAESPDGGDDTTGGAGDDTSGDGSGGEGSGSGSGSGDEGSGSGDEGSGDDTGDTGSGDGGAGDEGSGSGDEGGDTGTTDTAYDGIYTGSVEIDYGSLGGSCTGTATITISGADVTGSFECEGELLAGDTSGTISGTRGEGVITGNLDMSGVVNDDDCIWSGEINNGDTYLLLGTFSGRTLGNYDGSFDLRRE